MNCTFCLVRFSNNTPVTLAAAFWLTKLILPGLAFIQTTSSPSVLAGRSFLATISCGLFEILFEVVWELVDEAGEMGVPLADVDGVAVRRRARDASNADAATGAADI